MPDDPVNKPLYVYQCPTCRETDTWAEPPSEMKRAHPYYCSKCKEHVVLKYIRTVDLDYLADVDESFKADGADDGTDPEPRP